RRYHPGDTIQRVFRNDDSVERDLGAIRVRQGLLDDLTTAPARPALWFECSGPRTTVIQRDSAPSHAGVAIGPLHGREDMRAHRTISIQDRNRALPDGLKGAPDIKALSLAADEHRCRLEGAHSFLRRLSCRDAHGLCGGSCCTRRGNSIELRLQV